MTELYLQDHRRTGLALSAPMVAAMGTPALDVDLTVSIRYGTMRRRIYKQHLLRLGLSHGFRLPRRGHAGIINAFNTLSGLLLGKNAGL